MANLLEKPWLNKTVSTELKEGIEWLRIRKEAQDGIKHEETVRKVYPDIYDDDGSNLRIPVDRGIGKRSNVQLIQFSPIAELSDGDTRICAKFSNKCLQDFQTKHGWSLTKSNIGALLAIQKFEILATPYGQLNSRVQLSLDSVVWVGKTQATPFGRPRSFQDSQSVNYLLIKLQDLRRSMDGVETQQQDSHRDDPIEIMDDDRPDASMCDTQVPFATQMPQPRQRPLIGDLTIVGHNSLEPLLAGNTRREDVPLGPFELLGLLGRGPADSGSAAPRAPKEMTKCPAANLVTQVKTPSLPKEEAATSTLPSQAQRSTEASELIGRPIGDIESRAVREHPRPQQVPRPSGSYPEALPEAGKATSANSDSTGAASHTLPTTLSDVVDYYSPGCNWSKDIHLTRAAVTVPNEQRAILNRNESWLPPLPGNTFPGGNIPIRMLEKLNDLAQKRRMEVDLEIAQHGRSSPEISSEGEDGDDGESVQNADVKGGMLTSEPVTALGATGGGEGDLSDEESSSPASQSISWPSSPQRDIHHPFKNDLPPDSSFPEAIEPPVTDPRESEPSTPVEEEVQKAELSSPTDHHTTNSTKALLRLKSSVSKERTFSNQTNNAGPLKDLSNPTLEQAVELIYSPKSDHEVPSQTFKSSPPLPFKRNMTMDSSDSETDIEMAVPQAVGEDVNNVTVESFPVLEKTQGKQLEVKSGHRFEIQVEETPYNAMKSARPIQSTRPNDANSSVCQDLSGKSKPPSTSVVPGTYDDAKVNDIAANMHVQRSGISPKAHSSNQTSQPSSSEKPQDSSPVPYTSSSRKMPAPHGPSTQSIEVQNHVVQLTPHQNVADQSKFPKRRSDHSPRKSSAKDPKKLRTDRYHFSQELALSQDTSSSVSQQKRGWLAGAGKKPLGTMLSDDTRLNGYDGPGMSQKIPQSPKEADPPRTLDEQRVLCLDSSASQEHPHDLSPAFRFRSPEGPSQLAKDHRNGLSTEQSSIRLDDRLSRPRLASTSQVMTDFQHERRPLCSPEASSNKWISVASSQEDARPLTEQPNAHTNPDTNLIVRPSQGTSARNSPVHNKNLSAGRLMERPPVSTHSQVPRVNHAGDISPNKSEATSAPESKTVYDIFKAAYPVYSGDSKHFLGLCRQINSGAGGIHKFLWDDFIIRRQTDYKAYLKICEDNSDNPMAYKDFYNEKIEDPLFTKKIMNADTLRQAFKELSPNPSVPTRASSRTASLSIPARRPPTGPAAMRGPSSKRVRRSLPWGPPPSARSPDTAPRSPPRYSLPSQSIESRKQSLPSRVSSMSASSRSAANSLTTKGDTRDGRSDDELNWYKDPNTPFKEWVSQYERLTSFTGQRSRPETRVVMKAPKNDVDVLAWKV